MADAISGAIVAATAGYVAYDILSSPKSLGDGNLTVVMPDLVFAPRLRWSTSDQRLYVADEWGCAVWRQKVGGAGEALGGPELVLRTPAGDEGRGPRAVEPRPGGALLVGHYGGALSSLAPGAGAAAEAAPASGAVALEPIMDTAADAEGGVYCAGARSQVTYVPRLERRSTVLTASARSILSGGGGGPAPGGAGAGAGAAAGGLVMPWGLALAGDGRTLICTQLNSCHLWAWDRDAATGALSNFRIWAELPGAFCSGLCLDAEGCAWVAVTGCRNDPISWNCLVGGPAAQQYLKWSTGAQTLPGGFVRVRQGGKVLQRILLRDRVALGCTLGGPDGCTLFMAVAKGNLRELRETYEPGNSSIWAARVQVGAAGHRNDTANGADRDGSGFQSRL